MTDCVGHSKAPAPERAADDARRHAADDDHTAQSHAELVDRLPARTSAWQCCGSSMAELVANLRASGAFSNPLVGEAMRAVDRRHYVRFADFAYSDSPMALGLADACSGMSISAPHLHAACLQVLAPALRPGAWALDVGCGSGWMTAAMAHLVVGGEDGGADGLGFAFGLELHREGAAHAAETLERGNPELAVRTAFGSGDGALGWPGAAGWLRSGGGGGEAEPDEAGGERYVDEATAAAAAGTARLFDAIHVGGKWRDEAGGVCCLRWSSVCYQRF